jgi:hypothetical protein
MERAMQQTIAISLLVTIKPPPIPETWVKPSIQRDCEHECSDLPDEHHARCMAGCESPPMPFRCGLFLTHPASHVSRIAVAVIVGWLVASTLAIRTTRSDR